MAGGLHVLNCFEIGDLCNVEFTYSDCILQFPRMKMRQRRRPQALVIKSMMIDHGYYQEHTALLKHKMFHIGAICTNSYKGSQLAG